VLLTDDLGVVMSVTGNVAGSGLGFVLPGLIGLSRRGSQGARALRAEEEGLWASADGGGDRASASGTPAVAVGTVHGGGGGAGAVSPLAPVSVSATGSVNSKSLSSSSPSSSFVGTYLGASPSAPAVSEALAQSVAAADERRLGGRAGRLAPGGASMVMELAGVEEGSVDSTGMKLLVLFGLAATVLGVVTALPS